jgi:hypothetical protein
MPGFASAALGVVGDSAKAVSGSSAQSAAVILVLQRAMVSGMARNR